MKYNNFWDVAQFIPIVHQLLGYHTKLWYVTLCGTLEVGEQLLGYHATSHPRASCSSNATFHHCVDTRPTQNLHVWS
jgi:hypothetical protein